MDTGGLPHSIPFVLMVVALVALAFWTDKPLCDDADRCRTCGEKGCPFHE